MTGYLPLLRKELLEVARTWRIWLGLGVFGLFGIIDPLLARFMNLIITSAVGDQLQITVPDPTWLDAWAQWTKDLSQTLLVIVLVLAAASVAAEVSSGTAIMTLTKPVSRASFVAAKFTAVIVLVVGATVLGTGLASLVTALVFPDAQFAPIWRAVGAWLVLAIFLIAATLVASCLVKSTIAAFGIGFAGYLLLNVAALWQPLRAHTFVGLPEVVAKLASGQDAAWAWPVGSAMIATAILLGLAIVVFRRREL